MKYLLMLMLAFVLVSCKKDKTCWYCHGNIPATGQTYANTFCQDNPPTSIRDANGNDVNFTCEKK